MSMRESYHMPGVKYITPQLELVCSRGVPGLPSIRRDPYGYAEAVPVVRDGDGVAVRPGLGIQRVGDGRPPAKLQGLRGEPVGDVQERTRPTGPDRPARSSVPTPCVDDRREHAVLPRDRAGWDGVFRH